ncbi:MAG: putative oxidoreductase [Frankiaceae bacterium]|nr:putative oxidoreductase [Frankiaceae bacterium]
MLRRLARPLLGVTFVATGTDALRDKDRRQRKAAALGVGDPQAVTRALAGTQIGAGALLALGRFPRLASLALAATVVPDALTGHAFWSEDDKQDRQVQRGLFVRDLGLLGGLLVSVADTGGRESVPHRAKRTARKASRKAAKQLP